MATKDEMLAELKEAGKVDADASADDFKADELKAMLSGESAAAPTVAETIDAHPDLEAGNVAESPVVQSTTTETPAEADESSLPNAMDAKVNDPPVRAGEPDIPIAQTLAAGAGEHTPPDPDVFDKEGRPRSVTGDQG